MVSFKPFICDDNSLSNPQVLIEIEIIEVLNKDMKILVEDRPFNIKIIEVETSRRKFENVDMKIVL